jgi:hypothetical protein
MTLLRTLACAVALGCLAPAWAINKCTGADGRVVYQDAPCAGRGETLAIEPERNVTSPIAPRAEVQKEGAFGDTWQRKNYLQSQALPQARAALAEHQRSCQQREAEILQRKQLPRHLAQGSAFAQDVQADVKASARECAAREESLQRQIAVLEAELNGLLTQD